MRYCCVVLLSCFAAITSPAEVAAELTRAMELERQGQVGEAERILLTIVRREEAANNGSLELAVTLNHLGVLYAKTGRHADAGRHLKRSIHILQALPKDIADQLRAGITLQLAELHLEMDRGSEAARLDLPLLLDTLHSPEDRIGVKAAMAGVASARGDLDTAERLYLEVFSFWMEPSRAAGSQKEIATMLNNLGVVALWQGRTDVARERLERSWAARQRLGPETSPKAILLMANLAVVCKREKRYDEAAMWLARSLAAGQSAAGEFHPLTVAVHEAYVEALKKAGRKSEARQAAREAAEARRSMHPSAAGYTVDYRDLVDIGKRRPR